MGSNPISSSLRGVQVARWFGWCFGRLVFVCRAGFHRWFQVIHIVGL